MIYVIKIPIKRGTYHYAYFDHPPSVEEVVGTFMVEKKLSKHYSDSHNITRAIGVMKRVDLKKWKDALFNVENTYQVYTTEFCVQQCVKVPYNGETPVYIQKVQPFSTDDHRYTLLK